MEIGTLVEASRIPDWPKDDDFANPVLERGLWGRSGQTLKAQGK